MESSWGLVGLFIEVVVVVVKAEQYMRVEAFVVLVLVDESFNHFR